MRYVKIRSEWLGHSDCSICPVRGSALFSVLGPEGRRADRQQLDDLAFPAASVVFHQGSLPDAIYTVREGAIKLIRYLPNGDPAHRRVLKPGDLAGLEAFPTSVLRYWG